MDAALRSQVTHLPARRTALARRSDAIGTLFLPPTLPAALVERPRLERRLGTAGSSRLTLVVAPAGAGKSTLVRSWLRASTVDWAWITFDDANVSAERFWTLLLRAVDAVRPDLCLDGDDLSPAQPFNGREVGATLVDAVTRLAGSSPVLVVLDDVHLLSAAAAADLTWLVEHAPPSLHLVVLGRSNHLAHLNRLRACGGVVEIHHVDLAFSVDETAALLRGVLGSDHPGVALAGDLTASTGGWAVALRLAATAVSHGGPLDALSPAADAAYGPIGELLIEEVLDQLAPGDRAFLRETAVLTELHPDACAWLTGRDDCRLVLQRLARQEGLVQAVGDGAESFRTSPVLTSVLLWELRAHAPGLEEHLRMQAAEWLVARGAPAAAIEQLLAARRFDIAFATLIDHVPQLYREGYRPELLRWLAALPDGHLHGSIERSVERCEALMLARAPEWYALAERVRSAVPADRKDLRHRLEVATAIGLAARGHDDPLLGLAPTGLDDAVQEAVLVWTTHLAVLAGDLTKATSTALLLAGRPRRLVRDEAVESLLAKVHWAAGHGDLAIEHARRAVEVWQGHGEPELLGMADALRVLALHALAGGRLAEAAELVVTALELSDPALPQLISVDAQLATAALDRAKGRTGPAQSRLERLLDEVTALQFDERVVRRVEHDLAAPAGSERAAAAPALLTEREREVLQHLPSYLTLPQIAGELHVTHHTVKTHVARIYRKLGVAGRSGAVVEARRLGLIG